MRFLLFHGPTESLNHFTDELDYQFRLMGHETYICNLATFDQQKFMEFCAKPVDASVCYDGYGIFDKEIYDWLNIPVVNIMMVHPMNYAEMMEKPPTRYIQLMPDEHHVDYVKRYYHLEHAYFAPHMASVAGEEQRERVQAEQPISILFPGGYHDPNDIYRMVGEKFKDSQVAKKMAYTTMDYMVANPSVPIEEALDCTLKSMGLELADRGVAYFFNHGKLMDNFIRMYYREKVVETIIDAGLPITILGGGWTNFYKAKAPNVSLHPPVNFGEVFPYMEKSKITLTVMPWFKAGTHDRIFNSLLHNSCPFTDDSTWLLEHLKPEVECAYFSLEELSKVPQQIQELLSDEDKRRRIIQNGERKVRVQYTSRNTAELIIEKLKEL